MKSLLTFTVSMICYTLTYVLGYRLFGSLVPKGKGFEVGSACSIGIMIISFTINFFHTSVRSDLYNGIGMGLAVGLGHSIYFNDRKQNKS